ncbi:hypothetical protein BDK51DRAFT_33117 [Blyttiomyces helicus]|uniref:Uncharacterized protein n=1 Tax=Blyttiomyces helicus TaxID=388810 RepID=A0A4P9WI83_9FUNG|nr:hypothetical protein BDK51DRAFT_33117 [Blyttiomyces helicus]|eukprot:RKO90266.1 hypothetical protein BDK51DRAFT_33117 [Blyttiomyces helicus]
MTGLKRPTVRSCAIQLRSIFNDARLKEVEALREELSSYVSFRESEDGLPPGTWKGERKSEMLLSRVHEILSSMTSKENVESLKHTMTVLVDCSAPLPKDQPETPSKKPEAKPREVNAIILDAMNKVWSKVSEKHPHSTKFSDLYAEIASNKYQTTYPKVKSTVNGFLELWNADDPKKVAIERAMFEDMGFDLGAVSDKQVLDMPSSAGDSEMYIVDKAQLAKEMVQILSPNTAAPKSPSKSGRSSRRSD